MGPGKASLWTKAGCWAWGHLARGMGHIEARCCLSNFGKYETWAKTRHLYGKATVNSLGGPKNWERQSLGDSLDWGKQCELCWWSLRFGACLPALWRKGSSEKQWPLPILLSGRKLPPPQFLLCCQTIQFFPICLWCLSSCCPCSGAQREWVRLSPCGQPFKRNCLRDQKPSFPSASISTGFYCPKLYGPLFLEPWAGEGVSCVRLGHLVPQAETSAAKISLSTFICHTCVWDQPFSRLCPFCESWCGCFFNFL